MTIKIIGVTAVGETLQTLVEFDDGKGNVRRVDVPHSVAEGDDDNALILKGIENRSLAVFDEPVDAETESKFEARKTMIALAAKKALALEDSIGKVTAVAEAANA